MKITANTSQTEKSLLDKKQSILSIASLWCGVSIMSLYRYFVNSLKILPDRMDLVALGTMLAAYLVVFIWGKGRGVRMLAPILLLNLCLGALVVHTVDHGDMTVFTIATAMLVIELLQPCLRTAPHELILEDGILSYHWGRSILWHVNASDIIDIRIEPKITSWRYFQQAPERLVIVRNDGDYFSLPSCQFNICEVKGLVEQQRA
jgi:hypothetical protein